MHSAIKTAVSRLGKRLKEDDRKDHSTLAVISDLGLKGAKTNSPEAKVLKVGSHHEVIPSSPFSPTTFIT